jgi:hypothetical protein
VKVCDCSSLAISVNAKYIANADETSFLASEISRIILKIRFSCQQNGRSLPGLPRPSALSCVCSLSLLRFTGPFDYFRGVILAELHREFFAWVKSSFYREVSGWSFRFRLGVLCVLLNSPEAARS